MLRRVDWAQTQSEKNMQAIGLPTHFLVSFEDVAFKAAAFSISRNIAEYF